MKKHIRPIWLIVILAIQGPLLKGQTAQEVAQKLQDINIPAYRITDTKLTTVIQHLISGAARFDQTGLDPNGIKITRGFDPAVEDPLVTVAFENGTLEKRFSKQSPNPSATLSASTEAPLSLPRNLRNPKLSPKPLLPQKTLPCPCSGNSQSVEESARLARMAPYTFVSKTS